MAAIVQTASWLVKLVPSAGCVKETSKLVADVRKCVVGLSKVLQIVVISTRIVSIYAEASWVRIVLLATECRILISLPYALQILTEIMNPSSIAELIHEDFVFDWLQQTADTIDTIETQVLRGNGNRFLNVNVVEEVETTMKELELKFVTATNTSETPVHSKKITRLENQSRNIYDEPHHLRPGISSIFVGRTKELKIEWILRVRECALITHHEGARKNELMAVFAARAENGNKEAVGVYWMGVDGEVTDVCRDLLIWTGRLLYRKRWN